MKRVFLFFLLCCMVISSCAASFSAVSGYILGDADRDGEVSSIDAALIQRKMAGVAMVSLDEHAADIDKDGLDIVDATFIQRYLSQIEVPYEIGSFIKENPTYDPYELPIV